MRSARAAPLAKPRGSKLRTFTVSGTEPDELPSRSRPHKPPAKVLSARKAAALSTGGGKLPPRIRKELDREVMPVRDGTEPPKAGAGKPEPKAARRDEAAEMHEARRRERRAGLPLGVFVGGGATANIFARPAGMTWDGSSSKIAAVRSSARATSPLQISCPENPKLNFAPVSSESPMLAIVA